MAHWIITNHGDYNTYTCSQCGAKWTDATEWTADISSWSHCDNCGDIIKYTENEYRSDLVHRPEATEEKSDPKKLAELGKYVAEGFAAGLKSGGFVMISRKDYDKMVDDFNICIEERDKALSILDKELRELTEERDQYLDILKKIGITEEFLEKMIPSSLGVGMDENPMTREKRITIQFRLREV